ncbi:MAG: type II toxin-antitoxin system RelE/ParE family toxin [Verrucomicrobia bacterium]|nr:type II toxin-antitoxin system RelE/ParE family toxin [Verrucomicrobiota bacterium]
MGYKVVLSPSALRDLQDIVRYIALDAPSRALNFGQFLISKTKLLGEHPELGRIVPEFGDADVREVIVRSYRVIYRVGRREKQIQVIRFWHAARGEPKIPG